MKKYSATSILITLWLFLAFTVLDIFQANAIHPDKIFSLFDFWFTTVFCAFSGVVFFNYKNKL